MQIRPNLSRVGAVLRTARGYLIIVGGITFASFYFLGALDWGGAVRADLTIAPFTFETDLYSLDDNSKEVYKGRKLTARRSDGTTVTREPIGLHTTGLTIRHIDYADGHSVSIYEEVGAKSTWPRKSERIVNKRNSQYLFPPPNCVYRGEILQDNETILGRAVFVVKHQSDYPPFRVTCWRDFEIGCLELQYRLEEKLPNGSYALQAYGQPVSLMLGEPDATLFDDGAKWEELKPSEIQRRQLEKLGVKEDSHLMQEGEEMDRKYLGDTNK